MFLSWTAVRSWSEPLRAASYAPSAPPAPPPVVETVAVDQPDFAFDEPEIVAALAPAAAAEPVRTITRIVDPSVADEDDEPLFPQTHYAEERGRKGGWLSLFGRPRHDAPAPQARSAGGAQPALEIHEDPQTEDAEDLEIPSFLRRLAN